jgi:hypothetical protein
LTAAAARLGAEQEGLVMLRKVLGGGAAAAAVFMVTAMASSGAAARAGAGPIIDISHTCAGQNAEVEQATWHRYVYEEWMGCHNSIGFSRSADGGRTWSAPVVMADSSGAWDPSVAVSPEGVVYVAFMNANNTHTYPVVETSFNFGRTFARPAILHPPDQNNWGDRDFIAAGPHGVLYLTWDYGPNASLVQDICTPGGSCAFASGDLNVVFQKSTDYGRTWGPMVHVSPGFPASGGDSAPMVVEPSGRIDLSYQGYSANPQTYALSPAYTFFTSSTDGGQTWSGPVQVGPSAGTMSLAEWWIDGAIGSDAAGNLYVTWDTQGVADVGWLSYSTDHGRTWSLPIRVTPDNDNATHIVEAAGGPPGIAYVGWLADNSPRGYAQYLRTFSIARGWLSGPRVISRKYGNSTIWPGDTFGISTFAGNRHTVMLSWGGAVGGSANSEIFAEPVSG